MLSEDYLHNLYKANYMQNPFEILTQENLERLEKHCKKTIHYEKGNLKEEHEVVLELLYRYQDLESNKQNLIEKLEKDIKNDYHITEYIYDGDKIKMASGIPTKSYAKEILAILKGEKHEQ